MVIGLGRCGSHITGTLAEIVAGAAQSQNRQEDGSQQTEPKKPLPFAGFARIFTKRSMSFSNANILAVEPVMIVGDVDETTYGDISKSLEHSGGDIESSDSPGGLSPACLGRRWQRSDCR